MIENFENEFEQLRHYLNNWVSVYYYAPFGVKPREFDPDDGAPLPSFERRGRLKSVEMECGDFVLHLAACEEKAVTLSNDYPWVTCSASTVTFSPNEATEEWLPYGRRAYEINDTCSNRRIRVVLWGPEGLQPI